VVVVAGCFTAEHKRPFSRTGSGLSDRTCKKMPATRTESRAPRLYGTRPEMVSLSQRERVAMIFRKNLPGWERTMRVVLGAIMIGCGLVGLPAGPLGYAIAAGGAIAIITGFFGFCPMCAMVGRKLPSP
jgi:Protein of unknown function (DUF2892)